MATGICPDTCKRQKGTDPNLLLLEFLKLELVSVVTTSFIRGFRALSEKISIQSPKLRWPDGLSWGPNGYLYIADSDIPDLVLASRQDIMKAAPFQIFPYKPGTQGRIVLYCN